MFTAIFEDASLQGYIQDNTSDPWVGTPFAGYVHMGNKQKGEFGERFVEAFFKTMLSKVERAATSTAGHDRVIDDLRTEIKFSLATRKNGVAQKDSFIINHISKGKDWERLVFFGINPEQDECRLVWFSKEDFIKNVESEDSLFAHQQGGKKIENDDYICTKVSQLLEQDWVHSITEW